VIGRRGDDSGTSWATAAIGGGAALGHAAHTRGRGAWAGGEVHRQSGHGQRLTVAVAVAVAVAAAAAAGDGGALPGSAPQPVLTYVSAAGQSAFGYGWRLDVPAISRQTERGVPRYTDETDVFMLSGAEDLLPVPGEDEVRDGCRIRRFRPR